MASSRLRQRQSVPTTRQTTQYKYTAAAPAAVWFAFPFDTCRRAVFANRTTPAAESRVRTDHGVDLVELGLRKPVPVENERPEVGTRRHQEHARRRVGDIFSTCSENLSAA